MADGFKSGFIGLVGPTNSGKSTLTNALVGQKVSIVSAKPQTTYHGIRAMKHTEDSQCIFTDTPGFQRSTDGIARLLNRVAERHADGCDVLIWVFDASNPRVLAQIEKMRPKIQAMKPKEKTFLALNKIDKIPKPSLLPLLEELFKKDIFSEIIPISAFRKDGLDRLLKAVQKNLPEGQKMYSDDSVTDRPQQFIASELIREKVYRATHQEVPYAVRVEIEEWMQDPDVRVPTIRAVIHVDSKSKRPILLGKGGSLLKQIGTESRREIEKLVGRQVCLKLHVNVEEDWKRDRRQVNSYLEFDQ